MIFLPLLQYDLRLQQGKKNSRVFDPIRNKWVALTPEEHVRQLLIQHLIAGCSYPITKISVEKALTPAEKLRRFDLVVYNADFRPWMLAECKAPEIPVTQDTLHQLLHYHNALQCRFWLLTNGHTTFCAEYCDNNITWLSELPLYSISSFQ